MTDYALEILDTVQDTVRALPEKDRRVVLDAIRIAQSAPFREGTRLTDELAGFRRIKKGRWRVFYRVLEETRTVRVLFVGYRKEGDRHDAYREFQRLLGGRR